MNNKTQMLTQLKLALVATGRTQRELAREAGMNEQRLSGIVRGVFVASDAERQALGRVASIPASAWAARVAGEASSATEAAMTPRQQVIYEALREAYKIMTDDELRERAIALDAALAAHPEPAEAHTPQLCVSCGHADAHEARSHDLIDIYDRCGVEGCGCVWYVARATAQTPAPSPSWRDITTAPKDETLAKAVKLLEALCEPCNQLGVDHSWRECRRCLAAAEFDESRHYLPMIQAVLNALPAAPVASVPASRGTTEAE